MNENFPYALDEDDYAFELADPFPATLTIALDDRQCFNIKATASGFDVVVPENVTMTECAQAFVRAFEYYLRDLKI